MYSEVPITRRLKLRLLILRNSSNYLFRLGKFIYSAIILATSNKIFFIFEGSSFIGAPNRDS